MNRALFIASVLTAAVALAEDPSLPEVAEPISETQTSFKAHRHGYAVGGLFLATGASFLVASRADFQAGVAEPHARRAAYSWQSSKDAAYVAVAALSIGAMAVLYAVAGEVIGSQHVTAEGVSF